MTPALSLEGVLVGYGGEPVLQGVNLSLDAGSLVVISGASGSGKSTFLRLAAGLLPPTSGRLQRSYRKAAWVPQEERLDRRHPVSAQEVVGLGMSFHWRAGSSPKVQTALARVGLGELGTMPFAALSGGQRQRVLVARALAGQADCLIMDEPTSALDAASAQRIREIATEEATRGALVLLATHQPHELQAPSLIRIHVENGQICEGSSC